MSLEQSIDRLSGLIEQLIKQLEAGRSAGAAPAPQAKPAKPAEAKPAEAKPAEAKPAEAKPAEAKPAKPAKPALDFEKDVKVKFQFLAANDRPKAVEILKSYQDKAGREGKLGEVLDPADYQEAYDRIEAALVSIRPPGV